MARNDENTDFMWIPHKDHILNLYKYKGALCHTVYNDSHYQVFYCDHCNAVYDRKQEKVFELAIDAWTRLVLKLETVLN